MIFAIVILSILVILLGYSTFNLVKKIEVCEELVEESDKWMISTKNDVISVMNSIRTIDNKGIFEEDDEVGQNFKQILKIIEKLEDVI